jgi:general secretion pathway protein E
MALTNGALPPTAAGALGSPGAEAHRSGDRDVADTLGAFLIDRGLIDNATLDRAVRATRTAAERLDRVLTKLGLLSETDLTAALCDFLSMPPASLGDVPAEPVLPAVIAPTSSAATACCRFFSVTTRWSPA